MIIKSITIRNFMCYSGMHTIEIGEHLTLIIGANGDGKTKFF
jgi:DNA sulfur modification protein DndD